MNPSPSPAAKHCLKGVLLTQNKCPESGLPIRRPAIVCHLTLGERIESASIDRPHTCRRGQRSQAIVDMREDVTGSILFRSVFVRDK
jgi:hypothetical protein